MYIYQQPDWPYFTWNKEKITLILNAIHRAQGRLIGKMEGLGFSLQNEASLQMLTVEVVETSEIEGEILDAGQVRSSVARRLGMNINGSVPSARNVDGVVEMMLDATQKFQQPLTEQRLFSWHASLFSTEKGKKQKMVLGDWRKNTSDDPMQVVSGPLGREQVHFEAPPSEDVRKEMRKFLLWFDTAKTIDPVLKAAIAHLWFVTIHPFEDGNGRIARTIADMQLARADGIAQRFYSMSKKIRLERKEYYEILERTQKGTTDITWWLEWFLKCLDNSLKDAEQTLESVLNKARYWNWLSNKQLNERQRLMLNKLLDGFDGKLTSSKWGKITKCSQDTAQRDITNLMEQGVLEKEKGGGRSTSYMLAVI